MTIQTFGAFTYNSETRELSIEDHCLILPPQKAVILETYLNEKRQPVPNSRIHKALTENGSSIKRSNLSVIISQFNSFIQSELLEGRPEPFLINVHGDGYFLAAKQNEIPQHKLERLKAFRPSLRSPVKKKKAKAKPKAQAPQHAIKTAETSSPTQNVVRENTASDTATVTKTVAALTKNTFGGFQIDGEGILSFRKIAGRRIIAKLKHEEATVLNILFNRAAQKDSAPLNLIGLSQWFFQTDKMPQQVQIDKVRGLVLNLQYALESAGPEIELQKLIDIDNLEDDKLSTIKANPAYAPRF